MQNIFSISLINPQTILGLYLSPIVVSLNFSALSSSIVFQSAYNGVADVLNGMEIRFDTRYTIPSLKILKHLFFVTGFHRKILTFIIRNSGSSLPPGPTSSKQNCVCFPVICFVLVVRSLRRNTPPKIDLVLIVSRIRIRIVSRTAFCVLLLCLYVTCVSTIPLTRPLG